MRSCAGLFDKTSSILQRGYDANSEMIFPASERQKHWRLLKSLDELGCDTMDVYGYLARYRLYIMIICF